MQSNVAFHWNSGYFPFSNFLTKTNQIMLNTEGIVSQQTSSLWETELIFKYIILVICCAPIHSHTQLHISCIRCEILLLHFLKQKTKTKKQNNQTKKKQTNKHYLFVAIVTAFGSKLLKRSNLLGMDEYLCILPNMYANLLYKRQNCIQINHTSEILIHLPNLIQFQQL